MKKGRIVKLLCGFMCICLSFCLFSFDSFASANLDGFYHISMNTPSVDDFSGYFEVLYENDYGTFVAVYFWTIYRNNSDIVPTMNIGILGDTVSFYISGGDATLYRMTSDGVETPSVLAYLESGDTSIQGVPNIKAFHIYGQGSVTNHTLGHYNGDNFVVIYNDTLPLYEKLYSIYQYMLESGVTRDQLDELISSASDIQNMINSILNYVMQEFNYVEQMFFYLSNWDTYIYYLSELSSMSYHVYEIWDYLTSYISDITAFPSDSEGLENFENNNQLQQDKLEEYVQESVVPKPDDLVVEDVVNQNVDFEAVSEFGTSFSSITSVPYVLEMLLVVFTLALISYVLYGKRA